MSLDSWIRIALVLLAVAVLAVAAIGETLVRAAPRAEPRRSADHDGDGRPAGAVADERRLVERGLLAVGAVAVAVASVLITTVLRDEVGTAEHVLAVIGVGAVYLVLGLALPAAVAATRPVGNRDALPWLAAWLVRIGRPMAKAAAAAESAIARVLPRPSEDHPASPSVGDDSTAATADRASAAAAEREMIAGVLDLPETTVREIMVPRVDIVAVELSIAPKELLTRILAAGHSRIPVYAETIDQIRGILYAKDLLPFVVGEDALPPMEELARPAHIVPESKPVADLLRELRRSKVHIAIVADEYGGTAGLVTIEDILEEIVGEIQDEYDTEQALFERVSDDVLLADGRLPVADAEDALGLEIGDEDDDFDSLGGFVQKQLGRLPRSGDRFETAQLLVEILVVDRHRVRQLRLTRTRLPRGGDPGATPVGPDDGDRRLFPTADHPL